MVESGDEHILVNNSGGLFILPMDEHIFFGRGEGNTININDSRVSRQHAEMWWDDGCFCIVDLYSANGTFVNGKAITSVKLKNGDILSIGVREFLYRAIKSAERVEEIQEALRRKSRMNNTSRMINPGSAIPDTDFTGSLRSMSAADLSQTLALSRRNGLLVVHNTNGKALLYFRDGDIVQAEFLLNDGNILIGNEAVIAAFQQGEGSFAFRSDCDHHESNVNLQLSELLLEAARRIDEDSRISKRGLTIKAGGNAN